jgi:ketosteroid isomerase-like protein
MDDLNALERDLNQLITQGKAMDGFEKYYAEDVVMQENTDEPRRGKAACREAEVQFFASVEKVNRLELVQFVVGDGVTFSEWAMDFVFKGGTRREMAQVARRRWKNGKVVDERFYYKG